MHASYMMNIEKSIKKNGILLFILALAGALLTHFIELSHADENDFKSSAIRTIAIDPGHGGYDNGASGPGGSLEKEVALHFARVLAKALQPDYTVVLTRNGDYRVGLTRRSSVANHKEADMFISIHVGGGRRHQMDAWTVFYYQEADEEKSTLPRPVGLPNYTFRNTGSQPVTWNQVQGQHRKDSRALAGCMKTPLSGHPDIREVQIAGAALRVLEGLDMPAIVIETGYLTHPTTEKRLNESAFLNDVAKRIKTGVDVYLTR